MDHSEHPVKMLLKRGEQNMKFYKDYDFAGMDSTDKAFIDSLTIFSKYKPYLMLLF